MIRVLVIEDHRLVAQGLEMGLRAGGFEVRSTEGTPGTLPALLAEFSPDVVLLDLHLADGRSGMDLLPSLVSPSRRVIVLTGESDPVVLAEALEGGADAILEKSVPFSELVQEITGILETRSDKARARRDQVLRLARAARAEQKRRLAPFVVLTRREEAVLAMLIEGVPAAGIAERSYVSLATVRSQIQSILTKLGVGSQLAAVSMAVRAGWAPGGRNSSNHL